MKENITNQDALLSKIKSILIKKAEGFYFEEETFEYLQKAPNETQQIDMDQYLLEIETKKGKPKKHEREETGLILSKKKVTTHFVPPDMLAIKILLENFGEKVSSAYDIENMTDEELIKFKDQLLENLEKKEGENES